MRIAEVLCACAICALFSAFFAKTGSVLLRLEQKNIYLSSSLERDKFICSGIEALLKDGHIKQNDFEHFKSICFSLWGLEKMDFTEHRDGRYSVVWKKDGTLVEFIEHRISK